MTDLPNRQVDETATPRGTRYTLIQVAMLLKNVVTTVLSSVENEKNVPTVPCGNSLGANTGWETEDLRIHEMRTPTNEGKFSPLPFSVNMFEVTET